MNRYEKQRDHRNEDGSYTCYVRDAAGNRVAVTLPPGPGTDSLAEYDRYVANQDDYWRQNRDMRVEQAKARASGMNEDAELDPIDRIADEKADVFLQAFGLDADVTERREVIETRRVIGTLSKSRQSLYEKRFVEDKRQADVAREEGVNRAAVCKRERKLKEEVKKKLADAGIDESYFDRCGH